MVKVWGTEDARLIADRMGYQTTKRDQITIMANAALDTRSLEAWGLTEEIIKEHVTAYFNDMYADDITHNSKEST